MKRVPSMVRTVLLMFCLYVVQFLIFPWIFPFYYRISNEATALYWISFAFAVFIGVVLGSKSILDWIPGNVWYLICVKIYSANGAYNAQLEGHYRVKWLLLTLLIYMVEFVVFQLLIITLVGIARKILESIRNKTQH